jgi:hypothetical protein
VPFTYTNPHEQSWRAAQEELAKLEEEREQLAQRYAWIDKRLNDLKNYLQALEPLIQDDPGIVAVEAGLTKICREFLAKNGRWITAGEMRGLLYGAGIDLKPYTNPMAVLHSVLKRVGQQHRAYDTIFYGPPGIPIDEAQMLATLNVTGTLQNLAGFGTSNRNSVPLGAPKSAKSTEILPISPEVSGFVAAMCNKPPEKKK